MEENKKYNFDEAIENAEKNNDKVGNAAVVRAKEKMAEEKLEEDARMVESRLKQADRDTREAEQAGRYASKKKNILKKYSEALQSAKSSFESTGDWKEYDKQLEKLQNEKEDDIQNAKKAVFGDNAWRYRD